MRLGAMVNLAAVPPLAILGFLWNGLDLAPLLTVPWLVAAQLAASTIMYLTFFRLQAAGGPTYLSQIGYVAAALSVAIGVALLGETYPAIVSGSASPWWPQGLRSRHWRKPGRRGSEAYQRGSRPSWPSPAEAPRASAML